MAVPHRPALNHVEAPPPPNDLTVTGDYTGLTMTWQQHGQVDGWTVYCDPLDGTETESAYVPQRHDRAPQHRFGDLPPGDHHVGVVSWRDGHPNRGDGCWAYASVLTYPADAPRIPVVTALTVTVDTMTASWTAQGVAHWRVRLLGSDSILCQELDVIGRPHVVLADLLPDSQYGLQVRAVNADSTPSPWCEPIWARTGSLTRPGPS